MKAEDNLEPITVTVETALRITGLGRTKFYQLINKDVVKTITVGKRRLVNYSSLKALVQ